MSRSVGLRAGALSLAFSLSWGCATQPAKSGEEKRPAEASASATEMRPKVETLLNGYERMPTDEDWKRLGPNALGSLEQIYSDPNALPSRRTRAVASMAQVDNPAAVDRLRAILKDPRVDAQYRATAAQALSARVGADALRDLDPFLSDKDARVREGTAKALSRLGGPDVRKSLEEQLANEEDPAVREVIQQSLTATEP